MPIKVFYGNDRTRIRREIERFLGKDYETIEGENLEPKDLPNIFQGTTLFNAGAERRILILDPVKSAAGEFLADYANTPHKVAILEAKPDAKLTAWRKLSQAAETLKFDTPELDTRAMFDIYRTAKSDGTRAVTRLRELEPNLEPKAFIGVMASQAFRDYADFGGAKEKWAIRELAKVDMNLGKVVAAESSGDRPWLLIESFLMLLSKY